MVDEQSNNRRFRLELGGQWEITDFESLIEALRISYSYFYWVAVPMEQVGETTKRLLEQHFWSGRYESVRTAENLYSRIPEQYRLRVASLHYASPGWIELTGWICAISLMAGCAAAWLRTGDKAFDLLVKIDKYFKDRKLSPPPKVINLNEFTGADVDLARALCFEFGEKLGLPKTEIEHMIAMTGNPISTLRFLTNLSMEAKRLVKLQEHQKLSLPPSSDPKP
ncbi:MAG: hypothetical protein ING59_03795 [Burkholderiales bacterium]|nr:hypothetical protein [Burkholderiales bacterium]